MKLIDWATKTQANKVKQHAIVTKGSKIKLKNDGSNFIVWLEEQTNHLKTMGIDSICNLGPPNSSAPYPVHDLFTKASTLFDSYRLVTLDQIIQVADKIYEETTAD